MTERNAVDDYIDGFEGITRARLIELRAIVRAALPGATEIISYKIAAYRRDNHNIIYFAGYKKHLGMYPMPAGDDAFQRDLAAYASGKSTARFPHDKPLPVEFINRLIAFKVSELPAKNS